jgi:hypothetical protein
MAVMQFTFTPPVNGSETSQFRVLIRRTPAHFDHMLSRALRNCRDDLVLGQYVPCVYGYYAMNPHFCVWLNWLRTTRCRLIVMFHDVSLRFGCISR